MREELGQQLIALGIESQISGRIADEAEQAVRLEITLGLHCIMNKQQQEFEISSFSQRVSETPSCPATAGTSHWAFWVFAVIWTGLQRNSSVTRELGMRGVEAWRAEAHPVYARRPSCKPSSRTATPSSYARSTRVDRYNGCSVS
jgi:hypothetical protein